MHAMLFQVSYPHPRPRLLYSRKHHADVLRVLLAFRMFTITPPTDPRTAVANDDNVQDGSTFLGERLTVQFARGNRHRENNGGGGGGGGFNNDRSSAPRPRRTPHRLQISGLPPDTSWQVCYLSPAPPLDTFGPGRKFWP